MNHIVVVMSDFANDYYHGVMKGVICQSSEPVQFVDLPIHHPQSIINAGWILLNSLPYFPENSVFLIVVDPGVGTERAILSARIGNKWIVVPDNGILSPLQGKIDEIYRIPVASNSSHTFHGRDVFSPAVRAIVDGIHPSKLGLPIKAIYTASDNIGPQEESGIVVDIDSFGNIITNITTKPQKSELDISVNGKKYDIRLVDTFSDLEDQNLGVLLGSCNTLELVVNQGSAVQYFNEIKIGDPVILQ